MLSVANNPFMLSVIMLNVIAECRKQALYAECHYAECRYVACRGAFVAAVTKSNQVIIDLSTSLLMYALKPITW
jgi:hypothetical protein